MTPILRPLTPQDEAIVWQMLVHAAHEPSLEAVQTNSELLKYAEDWGRAGDMGWVAVVEHHPIGATWIRQWSGPDKGYGYLDDTIPELAIAVLPDYQGQGVGTQLLTQMISTAQAHYPAISLSARLDNPAMRLYQRLGFVAVAASDVPNRVGGSSVTMVYRLS